MDADKARKNVLTHKESMYKNFLKDNKKEIDRIFNNIEKNSMEGKDEMQIKVPEKDADYLVRYLQSRGFKTIKVWQEDESKRSLNIKW